MAEEVPVVQNWKLLLVAAVLAVLTVVIYNVHIKKVKDDLTGQTVALLKYKHGMKAGDKVKATDVEEYLVPKDIAGNLGNVMLGKEGLDFLSRGDQPLFEEVQSGQFVEWQHVTGQSLIKNVAGPIHTGWVAIPIKIDPDAAIGSVRPGTYIHVLAVIGTPAKLQMVLKNVRVFEVQGKGARDPGIVSRGDDSLSSYRTIAIEVPSDLGIRLINALSHATGFARIQLPNMDPAEIGATPKLEGAVDKFGETYEIAPSGI